MQHFLSIAAYRGIEADENTRYLVQRDGLRMAWELEFGIKATYFLWRGRAYYFPQNTAKCVATVGVVSPKP